MATRTDILLHRISFQNEEALRKLDEYTRRVQQSEQRVVSSTNRSAAGFQSLSSKISLVRATIIGLGSGAAAGALRAFVVQAERIHGITSGFETLTRRSVQTADVWLQKMRPAAQGLLTDLELMQAANQAIILGLPVNAARMADLTDKAIRLGRALGVDASRAIDSFVTGVGRQSRLMLDNIGVIVKAEEAYGQYAKRLNKTSEELTDIERKTAFAEAAFAGMDEAVKGLTPSIGTLSGMFRSLWTEISNATAAAVDWINKVPGRIDIQSLKDLGIYNDPSALRSAGAGGSVFPGGGALPPGVQRAAQQRYEFLSGLNPPGAGRQPPLLTYLAEEAERARQRAEALSRALDELLPKARKFVMQPLGLPQGPVSQWQGKGWEQYLDAGRSGLPPTLQPALTPGNFDELNVALELHTELQEMFIDNAVRMAEAMEPVSEAMRMQAELVNMLASGFGALGGEMLAAALAGEKSNISFKAVLRQLSQSALAQAIYETAIGIAASTPWGAAIYGPAPIHFKAAATFGAAGAALGVAARFAGGGSGSVGTAISTPGPTPLGEPAPRPVTITIFLEGQGVVQDMESFARTVGTEIKRQFNSSGQVTFG